MTMRRVLLACAIAAALTGGPARADVHIGPAVTITMSETFSVGAPFPIDGRALVEAAGLPLVERAVGLPFVTVDLFIDGAHVTSAATDDAGNYQFTTTFEPGATTHAVRVAIFSGIPALETSSVTVTTRADRIISELSVVPAPATASLGVGLGLRACGLDDQGRVVDLTDAASWTSSDDSVATVSNAAGTRGVVTGLAVGTAVITASFEDATGILTAAASVGVTEGQGSAPEPCPAA